jgi:sugar lactone lactonase YvrE
VVATPGGRYVTDAGGNSLLRVAANGSVSLVASFAALPLASPPPLPASQTAEAVPTEVVIGPDGAFYVSTLTGAPFENGLANVYRVVPGQAPKVYQSGFRTIIDIDFGPDGSLYVLEHSATSPGFAAPGKITRITPDNVRHVINTGTRLMRPTAIVVGEDGAIYVSNMGAGFAAGVGEVLKIAVSHTCRLHRGRVKPAACAPQDFPSTSSAPTSDAEFGSYTALAIGPEPHPNFMEISSGAPVRRGPKTWKERGRLQKGWLSQG